MRRRLARMAFVGSCALLMFSAAACGPAWVYTFNEAERIARPKERPILVFYRDHLDVASARIREVLEQPETMALLEGYVACSLISAYDPNRKFVAQYGVTSPPALIVIHPDGTYHALADVSDAVQIRAFLSNAKPPGQKPNVNRAIPRPTDYLIRAEGTFERARERARRQNRKMMILYKWWLDANSNEMITRMSRPEIAAHCTETINCVLDWDYTPNRKHVAQYGVTKFPAIIVVHQNGSFQKREGLGSVRDIVGFLSSAMASNRGQQPPVGGSRGAQHRTSGSTQTRVPTPLKWQRGHDAARIRAQRESRGLFIFYEAPSDETSMRMARLLDTQGARNLFKDTVNCRASASDPLVGEAMRQYDVDRAPAFIAVKPDGTHIAKRGSITISDLRRLRDFLGR
ncbi:MAG: hypothetical protein GXP29_04035 [Planctomycetes bacterium]|nr:hypothetical protein [Planctomycetota bacterium]